MKRFTFTKIQCLAMASVAAALPACTDPAPEETTEGSTSSGSPSTEDTSVEPPVATTTNESSTGDSTTAPPPADSSGSSSTTTGEPIACENLDELYDIGRVEDHLEALYAIAVDNGGNRSSGRPGFDASRDYVVEQLEGMGYTPVVSTFGFDYSALNSEGQLSQSAPSMVTYSYGDDFGDFRYGATGSVEGAVYPVDLQLFLGNESTSGCEPADFDGMAPGSIALIQRGGCGFYTKVSNAEAAGAIGAVVFNQGNTEDRMDVLAVAGLIPPELGVYTTIPAVFASYPVGEALAQDDSAVVAIETDIDVGEREASNIIVQTEGGASDDVLMLGAHLDSVPEGPGINDNGTGSASLLEVARIAAGCDEGRALRFAWWGAEEWGLWGSFDYVDGLSETEAADISLYLNFDMVGSPNYVHARYDGDGSAFGDQGPEGSASIEQFFADDFADEGIPLVETPFDGRSDYLPFILNDIPSGGLFTGAEQLKTAEQAAVFGGAEGEAYDACYHLDCDTVDNVDMTALEVEGRAIARATEVFGPQATGLMSSPKAPPTAAAEGHSHAGCELQLADR